MDVRIDPSDACPITRAVGAIGGKWKIPLLWHLRDGPRRYGALNRAIPAVSERMLVKQLRELERDGLVRRTAFPEVPPRVEYALTPAGCALVPALDGLAAWARAHLAGGGGHAESMHAQFTRPAETAPATRG